jgi:hypothetical protein
MKATCVCDIVDEAVNTLPFARRRLVKLWMRFRPEMREVIESQVIVALMEMEESSMTPIALLERGEDAPTDVSAASLTTIGQAFGSEAFSAQTRFAIDLERLERLLQIVIEYLPKILEILLPLFLMTVAWAAIGVSL